MSSIEKSRADRIAKMSDPELMPSRADIAHIRRKFIEYGSFDAWAVRDLLAYVAALDKQEDGHGTG